MSQERLYAATFSDNLASVKIADIPQLRDLPVAEKLLLVEELWSEIASRSDSLPVPDWHVRELDQTLAEYEANPAKAARGRKSATASLPATEPQITSMIRPPSSAICTMPANRGVNQARSSGLLELPIRSHTTTGGALAALARSAKSSSFVRMTAPVRSACAQMVASSACSEPASSTCSTPVAGFAQPAGHHGRQLGVDDKSHITAVTTG